MTKYAIEQGVIDAQDEDDAAEGYINSLMFKGSGYDTNWRPWFLMYGLKPIIPRDLFVKLVARDFHKKIARVLPRGLGVDPLVFFAPRLINGALFGYDMRAKYLGWRFAEMLQYSMARKLRARRRGLRGLAENAPSEEHRQRAAVGSKVNFLFLRNRKRAEGTETTLPGAGLLSRMKGKAGRPHA